MKRWSRCLRGGKYHYFHKSVWSCLWTPLCGSGWDLTAEQVSEGARDRPRVADRCKRCDMWFRAQVASQKQDGKRQEVGE